MDEHIKKSDVEQIYNGLKEVAEGQMQGADTISMITLNGLVGGINMLMEGVKSLAPADVAPVVHARWESYAGDYGCPRCSNCKTDALWDDFRGEPFITKRCPNCGALMDGHITPAQRMAARLKERCNHDT